MGIRNFIQNTSDKVIAGAEIAPDDALRLTTAAGSDLYLLFAEASRIREHFKG
ncbi:MAG: biotin synthase BioB, partial [Verrucomicrobia bacterium]|nr:biotin synthase BioB [Deltaproteobacteria bacterium]